MTDDQINIAIAEACGWNNLPLRLKEADVSLIKQNALHDSTALREYIGFPDYCHDLNAMHEAETLMDGQWMSYEAVLRQVCRGNPIAYATARQRAEAFLRTLGKWKE